MIKNGEKKQGQGISQASRLPAKVRRKKPKIKPKNQRTTEENTTAVHLPQLQPLGRHNGGKINNNWHGNDIIDVNDDSALSNYQRSLYNTSHMVPLLKELHETMAKIGVLGVRDGATILGAYNLACRLWSGDATQYGYLLDKNRAIKIWQALVKVGHPDTTYQLACRLWCGDAMQYGVPLDQKQAFQIWQALAKAGHPGAKHQLACLQQKLNKRVIKRKPTIKKRTNIYLDLREMLSFVSQSSQQQSASSYPNSSTLRMSLEFILNAPSNGNATFPSRQLFDNSTTTGSNRNQDATEISTGPSSTQKTTRVLQLVNLLQKNSTKLQRLKKHHGSI